MSTAELIQKLNDLNLSDTGDLEEDIPEVIVTEYPELSPLNIAEDGIDPDEHRWYVTSVSVISVRDEYIGVRIVSTVKSEDMGVEDCGNILVFFRMKKVMAESFEKA